MKKEQYIQPTIQSLHVMPSSMICGSGSESGTLPSGSSGDEPTSSGGVITGDAKSFFEDDFEEEE